MLCGPRAAGRDAFCRAVTSPRALGCHHQGSGRRAAGRQASLCVSTADDPPARDRGWTLFPARACTGGRAVTWDAPFCVFPFPPSCCQSKAMAMHSASSTAAVHPSSAGLAYAIPSDGVGDMGAHSLPCCEAMWWRQLPSVPLGHTVAPLLVTPVGTEPSRQLGPAPWHTGWHHQLPQLHHALLLP